MTRLELMFQARSQVLVTALYALTAARTAPAQERPMTQDQAVLPAGSEKAVKTALAADAGAVLDEAGMVFLFAPALNQAANQVAEQVAAWVGG